MTQPDPLRTALIYHPGCLAHDTGRHPENAERLLVIRRAVEARYGEVPWITPAAASLATVYAVHDPAYVQAIADLARRGGGHWDYDTIVSPASYDAALLAAGAACGAIDAVVAPSGAAPASAFALTRPPGHHAGVDSAMGFCLFNNVAVAARHAQRAHGIGRVLIVDWDVHHGNGTQDIFYQDGTVAYFSTHEWPLYPGTGRWTESGAGAGTGLICNVPLPPGTGDGGYRAAFREILVPFARRVQPDLILVSAGYDAHYADPLAQMAVSTGGYGDLTGIVADLAAELCDGRLAFVLEGGYALDALAPAVVTTLARLNGSPALPPPNDEALAPGVRPALDRVIRHHNLS